MNNAILGLDIYLAPTYFIDAGHPDIVAYTNRVVGNETDPKQKAIRIYNAVRDDFRYNPYNIDLHHKELKASSLLNRPSKSGYCIEKACLLAACLRAAGIPTRLCFFNVRNHIGVEKFIDTLKTDVLVFHACCDVYLDGKWLKATPAFNKELCNKLGVQPLEFNGETDSIFQQYDKEGHQFMEYLQDYGTFHDVPHDMFVMLLKQFYPHFFKSAEDKAMIK
jgi:transglutaminase-like putative cysteine protease